MVSAEPLPTGDSTVDSGIGPKSSPPDRPTGLGQAPVDDEGFSVAADHHVVGLEVSVEDSSTVGVGHGVADVEEPTEQLLEGEGSRPFVSLQGRIGVEGLDGVLERVAPDEPHGVIGAAVVVVAQAVDGDDPGVFEASGDLGLDQESGLAAGVVGVLGLDLLEGDLAVQLVVAGDEDDAQAPFGVVADLAVAAPARDVVGRLGGTRGVGVGLRIGGNLGDRVEDFGVVDPSSQLVGQTLDRADGGEAGGGVAVVLGDVAGDHRFEHGSIAGVEGLPLDEDLAQRAVFFEDPGVSSRRRGRLS